jgi:hypothetical protein
LYRGNFHKKVGEKYPRIIVDVFPQPNNTIKLAKDTLDGFKKEFEEGLI